MRPPRPASPASRPPRADQTVLTVEYLQALARIGDGRATKMVIPADFSGLLGTVAALAEVILPDGCHRRGAAEEGPARSPSAPSASTCPRADPATS